MENLNRISTNYPSRLSIELKKLYKQFKEKYTGKLHFRQYMLRYIFSDPMFGIHDTNLYRGILVYHSTGTGKTRAAASILLSIIDIRPVVTLMPKSLQSNFIDTVKFLLNTERATFKTQKTFDAVMENIKFVTIDAYNSAQQVISQGTLDNKMLIIDEAHNLFKGIINSSNEETNSYKIYKLIMDATNLRIVFLTGTPITKDPFELVPCFNMLTGINILPLQYDTFYRFFISNKNKIINKNKLQNRLFGLVSHISLDEKTSPDDSTEKKVKQDGGFPEDLGITLIKLEMSEVQYTRYRMMRCKEEKSHSKKNSQVERYSPPLTLPSGNKKSSYYVGSRQLSNFAGPLDVEPENLKAEHFTAEASPKMSKILKMLEELDGLIIVYSQFSGMGGLEALAKYLELAGYERFVNQTTPKMRYALFTGNVDINVRTEIKKIFSSKENTHGDVIRILLISSVAAEGIDLKCVRHVIILEMYWYWSRIQQVIARAVRLGSHDRLPIDKRNVKTYILISIANKKIWDTMTEREQMTIDERFYTMSIEKKVIINEFLTMIKEVSLECVINEYKNCRVCLPDNNKLFSNPEDISVDIEVFDPCNRTDNAEVNAQEIVFNNVTYYYIKSDSSVVGYKIFIYNKYLDGYVELVESNKDFFKIVNLIKNKK
jgi:superfamily II DNA or RNA helicase